MAEETKYKNPFVGLRSFEEDEDYLFFGRKIEINDLLKKFSQNRFLSVIGSSGSGKSSLVKSGLLPALYSGFLSVGHNWRVAMIKPGNDPIGNLAKALSKEGVLYEKSEVAIPYETIIESTLRRSSAGLHQVYVQARLPQTENLLIVVDQFEELFRFSKYEKISNQGVSDALNFINLLLNASRQNELPVYVLLTMRSDFLGDCAQFRGLPEAINEGQYLVPRMTRDEVKEAISGPIAVGGAQITQSLLTRLLNDVANDFDQLPVLQHAMMRTWEAWVTRNQHDTPICLDDYLKIGGMSESLSQHANEAYDELKTEEQKRNCEIIFKALTDKAADVRGTRRPRSVSDLSLLTQTSTTEVMQIIDVFRRPGRTFLMPPPHISLDDTSIIDISHESLMRVWDKLKGWTIEEVQNAELFRRIADAALRESNGSGNLWIDPELKQGLEWRGKFNNNEELIEVWAKTFNLDTKLALRFLERSNIKSIKLINDAQAEEKAKEKSIELRRRSKRLTVFIGLLSFLVAGAAITTYKVSKLNADLLKQTKIASIANDSLKKEKIKLQAQKEIAEEQTKIALAQSEIARYASFQADSAKKVAEGKAVTATYAQQAAELEKLKAVGARNEAEVLKRRSDSLAENNRRLADASKKSALKSAATKYQKKIRDFPTDENKIKYLKYKSVQELISYCDHLDILKDTLTKLRIKDATIDPQDADLINHELYDKVYFSLKGLKEGKKAIERNPGIVDDNKKFKWIKTDTIDLGKGFYAYMDFNKFKILIKDANKKSIDSIMSNSKIVSLIASQKDSKIIYATSDNYLHIYKFDINAKPIRLDDIAMGGKVTAIGYHDDLNIIYFGLEKGEIGYINFKTDGRNQPIYRNNLGNKITAVEFFLYENNAYLFAASYLGKAIVFELGNDKNIVDNFLVPDKKLNGIELPEYFGVISKAMFLNGSKAKGLLLVSSKETYLWNPFTRELLNKLKLKFDENDLRKVREDKVNIYY